MLFIQLIVAEYDQTMSLRLGHMHGQIKLCIVFRYHPTCNVRHAMSREIRLNSTVFRFQGRCHGHGIVSSLLSTLFVPFMLQKLHTSIASFRDRILMQFNYLSTKLYTAVPPITVRVTSSLPTLPINIIPRCPKPCLLTHLSISLMTTI